MQVKLFLCYYLLLWTLFIYGLIIDDTDLIVFAGGVAIGSLLGIYFERKRDS